MPTQLFHISEAVHVLRTDDGQVVTNVPRDLIHHSPDGFEFGYAGSGPADLALNIAHYFTTEMGLYEDPERTADLWDGSTCGNFVWYVHQFIKLEFIAPLPREGGAIPADRIRDYLRALHTDAMAALQSK